MTDYVPSNGSKIKQLFSFICYVCKINSYILDYILLPMKIQQPTYNFPEQIIIQGSDREAEPTRRRERERERKRGGREK